MPPKKMPRIGGAGKMCDISNPRVILTPLRADTSARTRYRYSCMPPTANLFNQPEFSDLKLRIGDDSYYAHRLVLCAGSEVFARMLNSDWVERRKNELELQEEEECVKVFDRFLYFMYTGTVVISENYVFPLFVLADKYNVKNLYEECVKVMENGLKVYVTCTSSKSMGKSDRTGTSYQSFTLSGSSSSFSDSSESDSSESGGDSMVRAVPQATTSKGSLVTSTGKLPCITTHLVASETFPLNLVMKMLNYCNDNRITSGALYNLEARLCTQISNGNYCVWNDLDQTLLVRMLGDKYFYCPEQVLFRAAKSWLQYLPERQSEVTLTQILCEVRYPLLSADDLYEVEHDPIIETCPEASRLVQQAIRYQLFRRCSKAALQEDWEGPQFESRLVKET